MLVLALTRKTHVREEDTDVGGFFFCRRLFSKGFIPKKVLNINILSHLLFLPISHPPDPSLSEHGERNAASSHDCQSSQKIDFLIHYISALNEHGMDTILDLRL